MTDLHAVSDAEAETLRRRRAAVRRFKETYKHNHESQRTMIGALRRVARMFSGDPEMTEDRFPWEALVEDEDWITIIMGLLANQYAHKTLEKDASAIRTILNCCRKEGLITHDEYAMSSAIEVPVGVPQRPAGTYLSEDDVNCIVLASTARAANMRTRQRDAALVLILASTGARADEVAHILLEDVFLGQRRIWLRTTKSGKPRDAWLHPAAVDAVRDWANVVGAGAGPLFPPLSRTGRPMTERGASMRTGQVRKVARELASSVGFTGVSSHDLRRFVVTTLLDNQYDIALVAKTVGHANPATTAGYDKRPTERQREAVASLNLPRITT